jgi:hypothetical protein
MTNGTGQMRGFGSVIGLFLATFFTVPSTAQDSNISWGYNTYGIPGMVDMPVALGRADAELGFIVSSFANQNRITLTFQISERLSASFRYSLLYDVRPQPEAPIADYRFDRSFSFHYRLLDEGKIRPAVALGINDLLGTGIYAGEYLVLSKTLRPDVRVTAGLGWGRLGSHGSFTNPLTVSSIDLTLDLLMLVKAGSFSISRGFMAMLQFSAGLNGRLQIACVWLQNTRPMIRHAKTGRRLIIDHRSTLASLINTATALR